MNILNIVLPILVTLGGVLSQACDESSCYPATGDLLIGRKDRLTTGSTCGIRRGERFCIVSHLEETKKCFYCDSRQEWSYRNPRSHRITNIVHDFNIRRKYKWWQAENGVEYVYIQLDLEAEFHFTHLVMTFKTFRPAAMLIEKSSDFGKTWNVYRYFAQDCDRSFPGISKGPIRHLSDVICTDQYSDVAPSTGGEIIFRVLPPFIRIDNPYATEVQDLLKITNLRVNFTKLHTLGDNLLDSRDAIKEKYYYALYEMVVRGSCSCYGHASRCLPLNNQREELAMVYGKCECTHNTKGLNCEQCDDFYNDLPWRPAQGLQTNACKRCQCNRHARRCHFDPAVYLSTNNTSGGVCDECQHNTMGRNCEECRPFFYKDPRRPMDDPYVCQPCDCDPFGSELNGECESETDADNNLEAGRCLCKTYVTGQRCDSCVNGYWNLTKENSDGCIPCACNTLGTIGNYGCEKRSGECRCKRFVTGRACDACMRGYYGLSEDLDGCKPCNCDVGGAYDNDCDQASGQCRCKPNIIARRCDTPNPGYFVPNLDYYRFEAEFEQASGNAQVLIREPIPGRPTTWTGPGFMRMFEGDSLLVEVDGLPMSMEYDIVVRYEPQLPERWDDVRVTIIRPKDVDQSGICANTIPQDDTKVAPLLPGGRYVRLRPSSCLEKDTKYQVRLDFTRYKSDKLTQDASVLIDSIILVPHTDNIPFFRGDYWGNRRRMEFERYRCMELQMSVVKPQIPDICKQYVFSISAYLNGKALDCDCDPTGSTSAECEPIGGQCKCKKNVIGRRCDQCAPGTYGFGPEGCRPCACDASGARDNFCDVTTGQCLCRTNAYGRSCNECQKGFYGFPSCRECRCNGRADQCHPQTGECIGCADNTAGFGCDRCQRGFYGDPRPGARMGCRPCMCPGGAQRGPQHAETCRLDTRTNTVICDCEEQYRGNACDRCAENYYGNPTVPDGTCQQCTCNNNINLEVPGSCDPNTGECLKCLYNTEGFACERCKAGFYGDAIQQNCQECVCNLLGTNRTTGPCDRTTGQCPCLPNVVGMRCDRCAPNHWKIASGEGCERCNCDPDGSLSSQCNEFDGQCQCKPGRGGRTCGECETNYWGDPNERCRPCDCHPQGSSTTQCDRVTGYCVCEPGVTGPKCDRCDRGTTGELPNCKPCGECFDSWDKIIMELRNETNYWVRRGSEIKIKGVIGVFDKEFEQMEKMLDEVKRIVSGANVTTVEVEELKSKIIEIRQKLNVNIDVLDHVDEEISNTTKRIGAMETRLQNMKDKVEKLQKSAEILKKNATNIQETDVTGAYNITKESQRRSREAQQKVDGTMSIVTMSEEKRQETENLLEQRSEEFDRKNDENNKKIQEINVRVERLTGNIVDINEKVCDNRGDPCDPVCGGGGCNKCGGTGCDDGAVEKANNAFKLAEDGEKALLEKAQQAETVLRDVNGAQSDSDRAKGDAQMAYDRAVEAKNQSVSAKTELETLLNRIRDFLSDDRAKPASIRAIAEEVLNMTINHTPEEVNQLAREINKTLDGLKNIDHIIEATKVSVETANSLKEDANAAKEAADDILKTANRVIALLREADEAQTNADSAIEQAELDIGNANDDLTMIETETKQGHNVANATDYKTYALRQRVELLKRRFTKNKIDVDKATDEANKANELADKAQEDASELTKRHEGVTQAVDEKYNSTIQARERTVQLRERAEKVFKDTNDKVENLRKFERDFVENEKHMRDISEEIERLNREMAALLKSIQDKTEFHRNC